MQLISRTTLKEAVQEKLNNGMKIHVQPDETARVVSTVFGNPKNAMGANAFKLMNQAQSLSGRNGTISLSGKYRSGFEYDFGNGHGSILDRVLAGKFSSNTLDENWREFWDAMRLDLTIRKTVNQTVRQNVYKTVSLPNADRIITLQEMFPYAFEFLENNGEGQAVPMGETRLGQKDTVTFFIKATGFAYTLLASLFDKTLDFTKVTDGVADAYALQRDEDALKPILDYAYGNAGTAKHTAADATGTARQEKLYLTLVNAVDDLGKRDDPRLKTRIPATGLVLLCNTYDANHIQQIMQGLPSVNERIYRAIPQIDKIVTYDTEYTEFDNRTRTYTGVTAGTAYLIKPNRYMVIATKRDLTMEADARPDVLTLAREQKSWYYSEAIYNEGIASFIQKITLPAW